MPVLLALSAWRRMLGLALLTTAVLSMLYAITSLRGAELHRLRVWNQHQQTGSSIIHDHEKNELHSASSSTAQTPRPERIGKTFQSDDVCEQYPDPGNITVMVKTGATNIHEKLPTQLYTSLRCVVNPLIFSDLEGDIADVHVYDVLSDFTPGVAKDNEDFGLYQEQQRYLAEGRAQDIPSLRSMTMANQDWRTQGKNAAWALDKYKFLHLIERAWTLQPNRAWYFLIEADTYLSWPNFIRWLPRLDAAEKLYIGNPVLMYERDPRIYFAHGGSGVLLSGTLVRDWMERRPGLAHRWDDRIKDRWFGDFVLADAIHDELQITTSNASLAMNSDEPSAIDFSPAWCYPVITLHHMQAYQLDQLWRLEKDRHHETLRFSDVFRALYLEHLPLSNRTNWDNFAHEQDFALQVIPIMRDPGGFDENHHDPRPKELIDPHSQYAACELACQRNPKCLQFLFITTVKMPVAGQFDTTTKCHLSRVFRLGRERKTEISADEVGSATSWMSGWDRAAIEQWYKRQEACVEDDAKWPPFPLRPAD